MPSKYFSLNAVVSTGKQFTITAVDTQTMKGTDYDWAEARFNDPKAELVLATGHHHIFSQGGRGDNTKANMVQLNALLQRSPKVKART